MALDPLRSSVTIVIPAYNEEANIARLVQQILDEPWGDTLRLDKLIIVDDYSDDKTGEITEELAHDHESVHVIRHTQRGGKNAGLREGMAACTSDIFVNIDADVGLVRGCLIKTIGLLLDNPGLAASSCINDPLPAGTWRERASRFQAVLIAESRRLGAISLLRLYAIRKRAILDLTLPDAVAEDLYIERWLSNNGQHCAVCKNATVHIRSATGLRDFAKQTLRAWKAIEEIDSILPRTAPPDEAIEPIVTRRALIRAIKREPLGFLMYAVWRVIVTVTPTTLWSPSVTLSNFNTSTSTKSLDL